MAEWLTPSEAARVLGLSKTHMLRLGDAGKIAMERTPLGRLFSEAAVVAEAKRRNGVHE